MKKGDIIWIRHKDCTYCSEVNAVYFKSFGKDNRYIQIDLIPIIGTCALMYMDYGTDIDFTFSKRLTVVGCFYKDLSAGPYEYIDIALDVHNLFYGEGKNNLDTVQ